MAKRVNKPVIIDYPEDRTALKREFQKIASAPGFVESVAMAKEMLSWEKTNKKEE